MGGRVGSKKGKSMSAVEQPMSIYHPDAATPRRVENVQHRISYSPPAMSWAEMARAEGHRSASPPKAKQPLTLSGRIRRHLRSTRLASRAELVEALSADNYAVGKSLSDMRRRGLVVYAQHEHGWRLTTRGRDAT